MTFSLQPTLTCIIIETITTKLSWPWYSKMWSVLCVLSILPEIKNLDKQNLNCRNLKKFVISGVILNAEKFLGCFVITILGVLLLKLCSQINGANYIKMKDDSL